MRQSSRGPALRRLLIAVTAVVVGCVGLSVSGVLSATGTAFPAATPQGRCHGPSDALETDIQGRVPKADYAYGASAAATGATPSQVGTRATGGFKMLRYRTPRATSAPSTTRRCSSRATCCSTRRRASAWSSWT